MILAFVITLLTACALVVLIAITTLRMWPVVIRRDVVVVSEQPLALRAPASSRAPPRLGVRRH